MKLTKKSYIDFFRSRGYPATYRNVTFCDGYAILHIPSRLIFERAYYEDVVAYVC